MNVVRVCYGGSTFTSRNHAVPGRLRDNPNPSIPGCPRGRTGGTESRVASIDGARAPERGRSPMTQTTWWSELGLSEPLVAGASANDRARHQARRRVLSSVRPVEFVPSGEQET